VALQEYVLLCCQSPAGGLRDKPSKGRDFYHTCYCLSGLSSAQHGGGGGGDDAEPLVVGDREANLLCATDPVHNVCTAKVTRMLAHAFPAL
jgi:protein farnesyltransferase subunit beta